MFLQQWPILCKRAYFVLEELFIHRVVNVGLNLTIFNNRFEENFAIAQYIIHECENNKEKLFFFGCCCCCWFFFISPKSQRAHARRSSSATSSGKNRFFCVDRLFVGRFWVGGFCGLNSLGRNGLFTYYILGQSIVNTINLV